MVWNDIVGIVVGSGIGAAIITAFLNRYNQKEQEKREFRENQIQFLYGPLYYWVSNSEKLFEINKKILDAYGEYFSKYTNSDTSTKETISKEALKTINIANEYVARVRINNKRMSDILEKYYSYIEINDIEIFKQFYEHYVRMETEINENGMKIPWGIYQIVGNISHLKPEVIVRVEEVFLSKKNDLEKDYANGKTAIFNGGNMQLKIKKLIAREGLIILGLLILSGLFVGLSKFSYSQALKIDLFAGLESPVQGKIDFSSVGGVPDNGFDIASAVPVNPAGGLLPAVHANGLPPGFVLDPNAPARPQKFDPDKYLKEKDIQKRAEKLIALSKYLKTMGYILLILGYPFWWIIRFCIWAVRTLKQKEV